MDIGTYFVHRLSSHKVPRPVEMEGETVTADVHMIEMELVDQSAGHGTITLRFFKKADQDTIAQEAAEGDFITLSMTKTSA